MGKGDSDELCPPPAAGRNDVGRQYPGGQACGIIVHVIT